MKFCLLVSPALQAGSPAEGGGASHHERQTGERVVGVTNPDSQLTNSSNLVGEGCESPGLRNHTAGIRPTQLMPGKECLDINSESQKLFRDTVQGRF